MATDRQTPCLYYICAGLCKKGRKADHAHYCQHCNKYKPRARVRYKNRKKEKLEKIRKKERYQSNESMMYEGIRFFPSKTDAWDSTSEELFFGKESEYVFEKTDKGEYMQVAV